MRLPRRPIFVIGFLALALFVLAATTAVADFLDIGVRHQDELRHHSQQLYGVNLPLEQSSTRQVTMAQALADPRVLVTLAHGLDARVVTANAAPNVDMIALWPDDTSPTHLMFCNEQGVTAPGFQRAVIATGVVETIVTGTTACDGVRRTPWGTILFSEEAGGGLNGGRVYELIDPLNTTGVTLNRTTGVFSGGTGAANLIARPALGRLSYEGFAIYANGLVYYGDENRPATGTPGGAFSSSFRARCATPPRHRSRTSANRRWHPARSSVSGSGCAAAPPTSARAVSSVGGAGFPSRLRLRLVPTSTCGPRPQLCG